MTALLHRSASTPVRVLIGDGRGLIRASLSRLLAAQPALAVVAEAVGAVDVVRAAAATVPDVAVLDPHLPGDALAVVRSLREQHPHPEVLLYGFPEDDMLFLSALHAGVKGFVDQEADIDYLVAAIQSVAAGEITVAPRLVQHIAVAYTALLTRQQARPSDTPDALTQRELDVLRLIAAGCSNRAAAGALGLSEHTIRAHLRSISRKLGVQNRVQAVSEAIRSGLIAGEPVAAHERPGPPAGGAAAGRTGRRGPATMTKPRQDPAGQEPLPRGGEPGWGQSQAPPHRGTLANDAAAAHRQASPAGE